MVSSSSDSSPCFERNVSGRVKYSEEQGDDSVSRDTAFSQDGSTAARVSTGRDSPVGSLQSFQDSGIGDNDKAKAAVDSEETCSITQSEQKEKEQGATDDVNSPSVESSELHIEPSSTDQDSKAGDDAAVENSKISAIVSEQSDSSSTPKVTDESSPSPANSSPLKLPSDEASRRHSDLSKSSESDDVSTEAQLTELLAKEQDRTDEDTKKKTNSLERPGALGLSQKDKQENGDDNGELKLPKDEDKDHPHSSSSSTTPTTSNPDLGSIPSSPSDTSSLDPFTSLYNQNSPSPDSVASPDATYNYTFPENSVLYSSPGGSKLSRPSPKEQLCGVFSVDLSEMRSLRLFFSNSSFTSGQLVIASRESQYKILHFHHGGLDKLAEVFEEWRYCIKQSSKKVGYIRRQIIAVHEPLW